MSHNAATDAEHALAGENARLIFVESRQTLMSVRHFEVQDGIHQLFRIRLRALSADEAIDLTSLVGQRATFELSWSHDRVWRGICESAELVRVSDEAKGLASYEIVIVPKLFVLSQRIQNRLFQHRSIPSVVTAILKEWKIEHEWRIEAARYRPLELRMQYGESDLAFITRLLEEAGISYYHIDDGDDASRLVLSDAPQLAPPRAGGPIRFVDDVSLAQPSRQQHISKVRLKERSTPARFTARDYDFTNPRLAIFTSAEAASEGNQAGAAAHEQYHYMHGVGLAEEPHAVSQAGRTKTPFADDRGVSRTRPDQAKLRVERMLQAAQSGRRVVTYEASVSDLSPGVIFSIGAHPRPDLAEDKTLLVTGLHMTGEVADTASWVFAGRAVHTQQPYRPPQLTEKPRIYGLQTAVVVGPEGHAEVDKVLQQSGVSALHPTAVEGNLSAKALTDNNVYVDEHGRVRVQFPWDREHGFSQASSIWMRVSQGWAGAGYGLFAIPRVGHEVLVAFIDGDPDSPLIVGRVHNAAEPPPYPLPESKTVSTWKTASSPGGDGFNELRFEDAAGGEHVYLQAQKDMDQLVKNNLKQAVGKDASRFVQAHDSHAVGGTRTEFVNVNEARAVGVNRLEVVGLNRTGHVGLQDSTMVGTRWAVTVARGMSSRLVGQLEEVAGSVGDVIRSAATSVLGKVPATPLTDAAESSLARFGDSLYSGLRSMVEVASAGVETDPGPPPTTIEMVDRQIRLTTGESSIVLDGPNVTISAQGNIVLHAMDHVSVLSEKEVAIGGRNKVAVVSATDNVIVQAKKEIAIGGREQINIASLKDNIIVQAGADLHLNPYEETPTDGSFGEGTDVPEIRRLQKPAPVTIGPEQCAVCGGALVGDDSLMRSCATAAADMPSDHISSLPEEGSLDGASMAARANGLGVQLARFGMRGDIMEHAVSLIAEGIDAVRPSYRALVAWLVDYQYLSAVDAELISTVSPRDAGEFVGVYLGWWARGAQAPGACQWAVGPGALSQINPLTRGQIDFAVHLPRGRRVVFYDRLVLQAFAELMQSGSLRNV